MSFLPLSAEGFTATPDGSQSCMRTLVDWCGWERRTRESSARRHVLLAVLRHDCLCRNVHTRAGDAGVGVSERVQVHSVVLMSSVGNVMSQSWFSIHLCDVLLSVIISSLRVFLGAGVGWYFGLSPVVLF